VDADRGAQTGLFKLYRRPVDVAGPRTKKLIRQLVKKREDIMAENRARADEARKKAQEEELKELSDARRGLAAEAEIADETARRLSMEDRDWGGLVTSGANQLAVGRQSESSVGSGGVTLARASSGTL